MKKLLSLSLSNWIELSYSIRNCIQDDSNKYRVNTGINTICCMAGIDKSKKECSCPYAEYRELERPICHIKEYYRLDVYKLINEGAKI